MNELVNVVCQKTGLDEAKAKQAVDVVLGFVRNKLPAPLAAQVDKVIGGDGEASKGAGGMGSVAKSIGGMFGGEKAKS
jgi:hypothetical protein